MTFITTLDAPDISLEIKCSVAVLSIDSTIIRTLVGTIRALTHVVEMNSLEFSKKEGTVDEYDYHMLTDDGREWNQVVKVDSTDALMNFDVSDMWRVSEFVLHRDLRSTLIELAFTHFVEKVEITWN